VPSNPVLSSTLTTPPPNWTPYRLAACSHQLRNTYVPGNLKANTAAFLAAIKAEIATNGLASTWARACTLNSGARFKVIIKKVPGAKAP
jgi:hypothetical protein